MPLAIKLGNASELGISGAGDLSKHLKPGLSPVLQLDDLLRQSAKETLASAPVRALGTSFKTDCEAKWSLDTVNLTLSFKPTATGSISILKPGELFHYTEGAGAKTKISIPVPSGKAYVAISLQVGLAVEAGAAFSSGNFGVSGSISDSDQFDVTNYKCFDASTPLGAAIAQAFHAFVLPFKAAGVASLEDGDYIDFSFLGKLNLGLGLHYGFSGLLAGRSAGEISKSFASNDLGKAVLKAAPTFQAGAQFGVTYDHQDTFRIILGRRRQPGAKVNSVSLYLFRAKKKDIATAFAAGLTLKAGATFNAASNLGAVLRKAASHVTAALPAPAASGATPGLHAALDAAAGRFDAFADRVNHNVNALLEKGDDQKIQLQIEQENTATDTALFRFDFDFNQPAALASGFEQAMEGRYADAIQVPGVGLAADSFVESLFVSRSSVTFQFFDLWKFTDVTTYTNQTDIIYAGNGVFRLQAKEGVLHESGKAGHTGQVEVYFTAEAAQKARAESVSDLAVKLNFALADTQNNKSARQTFEALRLLNDPALDDQVARMSAALAPASIVHVTCRFNPPAFARFQADPPRARAAPIDARNYNTFAGVIGSLDAATMPALCSSYDNWAIYNVAKCGGDGSTEPPDRTSGGNLGGSGWPGVFPSLETLEQARVGCYFEAGRHFMNLCGDLGHLTSDIAATDTEARYESLMRELNGIIQQDVPVFFIKSALIALLKVSGSAPAHVERSGLNLSFEAG